MDIDQVWDLYTEDGSIEQEQLKGRLRWGVVSSTSSDAEISRCKDALALLEKENPERALFSQRGNLLLQNPILRDGQDLRSWNEERKQILSQLPLHVWRDIYRSGL